MENSSVPFFGKYPFVKPDPNPCLFFPTTRPSRFASHSSIEKYPFVKPGPNPFIYLLPTGANLLIAYPAIVGYAIFCVQIVLVVHRLKLEEVYIIPLDVLSGQKMSDQFTAEMVKCRNIEVKAIFQGFINKLKIGGCAMLMHHWLILVLVGLGVMWFLVIKLSIWWIVGAIVFCVLIPIVTRDQNLLKILLPVGIVLTILAVLLN
jgi:hypothetical protein